MSDPISIAGTASGLVSLGIQVYGGLNTYLNAVKSRDEDLASARRLADSLRASLRVIDASIQTLQQRYTTPTDTVTKCLQACQTELHALETLLADIEDSNAKSTGLKGKLKDGKKKLSYPFHQPTLHKVEASVSRVNAVLQTAIQTLICKPQPTPFSRKQNSNVNSDVSSTLEKAVSDTLVPNVAAIGSGVGNIATTVALIRTSQLDNHSSLTHKLDEVVPNLKKSLSEIKTELYDSHTHLEARSARIAADVQAVAQIAPSIETNVQSLRQDFLRVESHVLATSSVLPDCLARFERLLGGKAQAQSQVRAKEVLSTLDVSGCQDLVLHSSKVRDF